MTDQQFAALAKNNLYAFPKFASNLKCPRHLKFIADKIQAKMEIKTDGYKLLMVSVPPRHGKSVSATSMVSMHTGDMRRISLVNKGDTVFTKTKDYKLAKKRVLKAVTCGKKKVCRITLWSGQEIESSSEHRYFAFNRGWVQLKDLTTDDFLAVEWPVECDYKNSIDKQDAFLLGTWYADGGKNDNGCLTIHNSQKDIIRRLKLICVLKGWKRTENIDKRSGATRNRLVNNNLGKHNIPINYLRSLIDTTVSTYNFRIPSCIWTANNSITSIFINAFISCDGHFNKHAGIIEMTLANKKFLLDLQLLLRRFKIRSRIQYKKCKNQSGEFDAWRFTISDKKSIIKYYTEIGSISKEKELEELAKTTMDRGKSNSKSNVLPSSWRKLLKNKVHWFRENHNVRIDKPGCTHINKVRKCAELENNIDLLNMVDNDIEWVKIDKIDFTDKYEDMYDLYIEDEHNFIANGIVVHNSLLISKHCVPWYLGNNPTKRVILTSYSSDLSDENSDYAKDTLAKWGPVLWNVHPSKTLFNRNKWNTSEGGGCLSAGIGGGITGFGADLFIIDDYFKGPEESESQSGRNKLWERWQAIVGTRLHPGCLVIILACMTGDTKVSMSNGSWKYLEDIKIGDEVLAYKSNRIVRKRILNWVKHEKDEIYEIKTGNNTVKANAKHPFLVELDSGERVWKKVRELLVGDKLISVSKNNDFNNSKINHLQAWLLGFMFGDGWITVRNSVNYNKRLKKEIKRTGNVTCVAIKKNKYKDILVKQLFKKLFNTNLKDTGYGYYRTEIQNTGRWFLKHGLVGNSHTKRLPNFIFEECLKNRLSFINGFCNADGWDIRKGKYKGYGIKLCNELLLEDIRCLTRSCGYKPTNVYKRTQKNKPPHSKTIIESTSYTFHFSEKRSNTEFIISKIRKINKLEKDYVYDITVEDAECFIADGLVSHNTRWGGDDLMGRLINQAKLEGDKFPFDWEYINLPALVETEKQEKADPLGRKIDEALWPKRYSTKLLKSAKRIVGPYFWNAEFQGEPSKLGGTLFKSENFRYYTIEALTSNYLCWRADEAEPVRIRKSDLKIVVIVDPALEIKKKNDPCGILTWGYSRKNKVWLLLDRFNDKIEHQRANSIIKNFAFKNSAQYILVENEKIGKIIVKDSAGKDSIGGKKIPFKEVPTKGLDKYTRAVPMATYCENERVFFPKNAPWLIEYETNIKDFPTGGHDEDADLTAYAATMEDKVSIAEILANR